MANLKAAKGFSLTLNSTIDCMDVWHAVIEAGAPTVTSSAGSEYRAVYNGSNSCTYTYQANISLTITYNSNTGEVVVNL